MLVLTRKVGEALLIDEDILVKILGVKGNQVKVGINAPTTINIARTELLPEERQLDLPYQKKE